MNEINRSQNKGCTHKKESFLSAFGKYSLSLHSNLSALKPRVFCGLAFAEGDIQVIKIKNGITRDYLIMPLFSYLCSSVKYLLSEDRFQFCLQSRAAQIALNDFAIAVN